MGLPGFNNFVQGAAKGVIANNADDKRGIGGGERRIRPFDKFREVIEERGFDLILADGLGVGGQPKPRGIQGQGKPKAGQAEQSANGWRKDHGAG